MDNSRVMQSYKHWTESDCFSEQTKAELLAITDQKEITDRFYRDLEFGTAGLRGILAAGSNRMNNYVVRRASKAIADLLCRLGDSAKQRGVVIAYDSRNFSREFAEQSAAVLAHNGVKVYLFDDLRPVPELSFALRHKGAMAGIVITASHNPKQYNGYKVYWEDGAQLPPDEADEVARKIAQLPWHTESADLKAAIDSGMVEIIGEQVDDVYIDQVYHQMLNLSLSESRGSELSVIYTPIHGTGLVPVERILKKTGFSDLRIVSEQAAPNGDFPTVKSPNPEDDGAFDMALAYAKTRPADILLATDPDADRLGVCVLGPGGQYHRLTGNQLGVILQNYIIDSMSELGTLPSDAIIIKSVVSTALADKLAQGRGVALKNVPVGFKFIGECIKEMEQSGKGSFIWGFEESLGYLKGTYARDKDAVLAAALTAEAALYYKLRQKTLVDVLEGIFEQYGFFLDNQVAYSFGGISGLEKIAEIMRTLSLDRRTVIGGKKVLSFDSYATGERIVGGTAQPLDFPKINLWGLTFEDGSFIKARPSGTEPKIRFYFCISGKDRGQAENFLKDIESDYLSIIKDIV